ncbi:MAG: hypothetical protein [Caudoviricetes sp.]|nr:MAG: hypothetical protein [Caudoviricetes sp.]
MKPQVTKESLAQWIAELESQPHLSLKEERYLAVMKRCLEWETSEAAVYAGEHPTFGLCYYNTNTAALKDGCDRVSELYESPE